MKIVLRVDRKRNTPGDIIALENPPRRMAEQVALLARFAHHEDGTPMDAVEATTLLADGMTLEQLDAAVDALYGRVKEAEADAVPPAITTP